MNIKTDNCPHERECYTTQECMLRLRESGDPAALRITASGAFVRTDSYARQYLVEALDGYAADYDIDGLMVALRAEAGSWEFDAIDPAEFWAIVAKFDRTA